MSERSSRVTGIASGIVTLLLVVSGLTIIYFVGAASLGRTHEVLTHQEVTAHRLAKLPPTVVSSGYRVPVTIRIRHADAHEVVLDLARGLLQLGPWIVLLWQLRRLLLSVREGDPFTSTNVRRLRGIGFLLLFGFPLAVFITQLIERQLAASSGVDALATRLPGDFGAAPIVALGVFVLAQVFAHGVRLREDVEGTV